MRRTSRRAGRSAAATAAYARNASAPANSTKPIGRMLLGTPDARAAQRESRPRAAAEGPVREQQRQQEQAEEGQSLELKKECAYSRGCSRKQAQRAQRQALPTVQAQGQGRGAQAAGQKEQMRQRAAQQMDRAAVLQAQQALRPQQRHFHGHAVHALFVTQQRVAMAALFVLVYAYAVIVQHRHAGEEEERADQPRAARRQGISYRTKGGPSSTVGSIPALCHAPTVTLGSVEIDWIFCEPAGNLPATDQIACLREDGSPMTDSQWLRIRSFLNVRPIRRQRSARPSVRGSARDGTRGHPLAAAYGKGKSVYRR